MSVFPTQLAEFSLRPSDAPSLLGTLLAPDGTRYWVPSTGFFYVYQQASKSVPDGTLIVAGLGGGCWQADTGANVQNSSGAAAPTAAALSAASFYSTLDFGGGTSASRFDNQVPIQAAIAAAAADPGRRHVRIPRDNSVSGPNLNITAPIELAGVGPLYLEGEGQLTTLRAVSFYGPAIIMTPAVTAPTPVQDGSTGFWGLQLANLDWLPLDLVLMGLTGLTGFCCEFDIKSPTGTSGVILGSGGQRGYSEAFTQAFAVSVIASNQIQVVITTSSSGQQTYTSSAALPNNVRTNIEIDFDQATTAMRVYIGGVFDGSLTMSPGETIVQKFENFILNGQGSAWPLMTGRGILSAPNATLYSVRLSNIARHTTSSSFTPSTTERTADPNTMLVLNFDPVFNGTCATSAAGMIKGTALINALGINGPAYIPWQNPNNVAQQTGCIIQDLNIQPNGPVGIWTQRSPNSRMSRLLVNGTGPVGVCLFDNAYLCQADDVHVVWQNQLAGAATRTTAWGNFHAGFGGPNHFNDLQLFGGDVGFIAADCGFELSGKNYILPHGYGGIFIKGSGSAPTALIDNCFVGDEGGLQSDFGIMVVGQAGPIAAFNVTLTSNSNVVVGSSTTWLSNGPLPGSQWSFTGSQDLFYTIRSITDNTHAVLNVPWQGVSGSAQMFTPRPGLSLYTRWSGGAPQILSSNAPLVVVDGGTCHEFEFETWGAMGNDNVMFKILKDADDGVFTTGTQNLLLTGGSQLPWLPNNGQSGQGRLYVKALRQGRMHKYPCPASNVAYSVPPFDWLNSTISPVANSNVAMVHLMSNVAGYEWNIDNTHQTGANVQNVTYAITNDGTTIAANTANVTIAGGKKARIAMYDANVGIVRLSPDT